jgi:fructose-bisphosphate aldolase class II
VNYKSCTFAPHPLVLHGASGVAKKELSRAVHLGIAKVNVATELLLAFTEVVRGRLADEKLYDPRDYLGAARSARQARAQSLIRLFGSAGKAG